MDASNVPEHDAHLKTSPNTQREDQRFEQTSAEVMESNAHVEASPEAEASQESTEMLPGTQPSASMLSSTKLGNLLAILALLATISAIVWAVLAQKWTVKNANLQSCAALVQIGHGDEVCNATIAAGLSNFFGWKRNDMSHARPEIVAHGNNALSISLGVVVVILVAIGLFFTLRPRMTSLETNDSSVRSTTWANPFFPEMPLPVGAELGSTSWTTALEVSTTGTGHSVRRKWRPLKWVDVQHKPDNQDASPSDDSTTMQTPTQESYHHDHEYYEEPESDVELDDYYESLIDEGEWVDEWVDEFNERSERLRSKWGRHRGVEHNDLLQSSNRPVNTRLHSERDDGKWYTSWHY